jgi:chitin-binding protein
MPVDSSAAPSASASASPSRSASPAPSGPLAPPSPPPPPPPPPPGSGWTLRWSPDPQRVGLGAFEGVEDDRAGTDPGVTHIYVDHSGANYYYRFNMPAGERDTSTDRQRNEVKGMNASGQDLSLGLGETWRLDWSVFIPGSLQGTVNFTHIMQLKMPGNGSAPILTMDLTRNRSTNAQRIQVKIFDSGTVIGATDLAPLHNTWLNSSLTFTIGDAPNGAVTWRLDRGDSALVNVTKTGVDTWLQDRVRPKWGIYRSVLGFGSAYPLADCAMFIDNLRAYQKR